MAPPKTTPMTAGRRRKVKMKPQIPREEKKKQNQSRVTPGRPSLNTPSLKVSTSKRLSRLTSESKDKVVPDVKVEDPDNSSGDDGSGSEDYDDGGCKAWSPSIKGRSTLSASSEAISKRDGCEGVKGEGGGATGKGSRRLSPSGREELGESKAKVSVSPLVFHLQ